LEEAKSQYPAPFDSEDNPDAGIVKSSISDSKGSAIELRECIAERGMIQLLYSSWFNCTAETKLVEIWKLFHDPAADVP
jgi:hypothetical protein